MHRYIIPLLPFYAHFHSALLSTMPCLYIPLAPPQDKISSLQKPAWQAYFYTLGSSRVGIRVISYESRKAGRRGR